MKEYFLKALSAIIAISVIVAALLAFFIVSIDTQLGIIEDGLGRTLTEPPFLASFFVFSNWWPGFLWWILDKIWFFGGLYLAILIYTWSEDD